MVENKLNPKQQGEFFGDEQNTEQDFRDAQDVVLEIARERQDVELSE